MLTYLVSISFNCLERNIFSSSRFFGPSPRVTRSFSVADRVAAKVALLGSSGGIGLPLSLLLKLNPRVTRLHLYDPDPAVFGHAVDLSHCDTGAVVRNRGLAAALDLADLVIVLAGKTIDSAGMTDREELFDTNAGIVAGLASAAAEVCPDRTLVAVVSNPVNCTLPIVAEIFKRSGREEQGRRRVFGVTSLDVSRARTFVAQVKDLDPAHVRCPVIGGHSETTIVPLLSKCTFRGQKVDFTDDEVASLTRRIRRAGFEVVEAKGGKGSSTLSMAHSAARFADSLLKALAGEEGLVECTFVASEVTRAPYFAAPVLLGRNGVERHLGLGRMSEREKELLTAALPELERMVRKGEEFVHK